MILKIKNKINKFKEDKNFFGCKIALAKMLADLFKPKHKHTLAYYFNNKKHKLILEYLINKYNYVIDKYSNCSLETSTHHNSKIVWSIWWQGEENAPELIKLCFDSMRKHCKESELIIITEKNCFNYIDIPNYIMEKVQSGVISLIHLADFIRMSIINKYGGLWLDATVYVSNDIPNELFDMKYYTTKNKPTVMSCVSQGLWNGTTFGGENGFVFFSFMVDFFCEYWKNEQKVIDYFLIDYVTKIALQKIPYFKKEYCKININNLHNNSLCKLLNKKFDEKKYLGITSDTIFHKIQRRNVYIEFTKKGDKTFYGYLVENN